MEPRISFITLGVKDLVRAITFYEGTLGLKREPMPPEADVAFFRMGSTMLALYPRHLLAQDAGISADGSGFSGIALAHNVRGERAVDELLALAAAGGGALVKPGQTAIWGGYSGYFTDPDGHLWEVAYNPQYPDL